MSTEKKIMQHATLFFIKYFAVKYSMSHKIIFDPLQYFRLSENVQKD